MALLGNGSVNWRPAVASGLEGRKLLVVLVELAR